MGFLSSEEVQELRLAHRKCREKRYAYRINAVLLLNDGYGPQQVADLLLMDDDTIRNYLNIFKDEGVKGLMRDLYVGSDPLLNKQQLKSLEKHLEANTYLKAKDVVGYVSEKYGVKYSSEGMRALMRRLGFVYKKPKVVPGKADEIKQRQFLAKYKRNKATKAKEDQIYFVDGCHPMLNPIAGYGWIKKGTIKEIPSNTGRERLNINGAYNSETKEVTVVESERINAQSTILLLDKIQTKQPIGKIYFISDNARYYRCRELIEYLRKHQRIRIIPLPPYSPNLNLIERLWRFYKKEVLYQQYYPNLASFREATQSFFRTIKKRRKELASLMRENFQIIGSKFPETSFG